MTDRERLIDLMIEAKRTEPETGSFTDYLTDCLLEHGVIVLSNKPKPLLKDENPFNTDVYCSYCGTNLSGYYGDEPTSIIQCFSCGEFLDNTKSITREEAEQALKEREKMREYIEREALLSELQEEIEFETSMYTEEQNKYFNMGLKCAIRDVKSQPAADVTEVRRGKWLTWEEQFPDRKPTKKNNLGVFCNNCHSHADNMTNYCPNCGAKMDGKEVE